MADRPHLRLVGGACPASLRAGVEREMELRLRIIARELAKFAHAAEEDLGDDELGAELWAAGALVQKARLTLAGRRSG